MQGLTLLRGNTVLFFEARESKPKVPASAGCAVEVSAPKVRMKRGTQRPQALLLELENANDLARMYRDWVVIDESEKDQAQAENRLLLKEVQRLKDENEHLKMLLAQSQEHELQQVVVELEGVEDTYVCFKILQWECIF